MCSYYVKRFTCVKPMITHKSPGRTVLLLVNCPILQLKTVRGCCPDVCSPQTLGQPIEEELGCSSKVATQGCAHLNMRDLPSPLLWLDLAFLSQGPLRVGAGSFSLASGRWTGSLCSGEARAGQERPFPALSPSHVPGFTLATCLLRAGCQACCK